MPTNRPPLRQGGSTEKLNYRAVVWSWWGNFNSLIRDVVCLLVLMRRLKKGDPSGSPQDYRKLPFLEYHQSYPQTFLLVNFFSHLLLYLVEFSIARVNLREKRFFNIHLETQIGGGGCHHQSFDNILNISVVTQWASMSVCQTRLPRLLRSQFGNTKYHPDSCWCTRSFSAPSTRRSSWVGRRATTSRCGRPPS